MLTEAQRIALDQREFHQAIAREADRMHSQPVPLSVVRDGKLFAENKLASLRRQLELATPEERPHVEEEIAEYSARLARRNAELAEWGDEGNVLEDPPKVDRPAANDQVSEMHAETVVFETVRPTARELRRHRLGILKAYAQRMHINT